MIFLDGSSLTLEQLLAIADRDEPVALTDDARERVTASRAVVDARARGDEPAYGINTGFGSFADVRIAAWLAAEQVPFALEAVRGTPADRKGGHLARYQGRVVLRETAQVPGGDTSFTDVQRWRWYNTNNIWIDLRALKDLQAADPAAPALPLIVNRKTVDPRDPASTPVIQLESAMGAAIGSIPGARAVHVPRWRFAPVPWVSSQTISPLTSRRLWIVAMGHLGHFLAHLRQRLNVGSRQQREPPIDIGLSEAELPADAVTCDPCP